jgi:type VI secretion system secreted protein VgrG
VVGAVYNATNMPPWELPASKTQSGIYTCSTPQGGYDNANTLRFEDKKGQEEIWLHAENTLRTEAEGSESHSVGGGRTKTVGQDETSKVQGNRTETVGGNDAVTVTGIRTEQAKEVNVTASDRITFTVGGSTITLTPSGITLQSAKIDLNP